MPEACNVAGILRKETGNCPFLVCALFNIAIAAEIIVGRWVGGGREQGRSCIFWTWDPGLGGDAINGTARDESAPTSSEPRLDARGN